MQMTSDLASAPERGAIEPPDWKREFISRIESFPTLANGCRDLYFYLQGKHCSFEGSAEKIGLDPLLAVEIVKSSKSAIYGSRGANSLEDAVQAIGLERLGRIALRLWLRNLMPRHLAAYDLDGGEFVRRSIACGAAMRYIYQGDTDQSQTAYAIGLLHSIGRIIVNESVRLSREEDLVLVERTSRRLAEAELREFGLTHAEVGGFALKQWGFSKHVYEPISAQFSSTPAKDDFDWTQSLAISRFTTDRVMEALKGVKDPLRGEGRAVYRGRMLSELFEYTLAMAEEGIETELN